MPRKIPSLVVISLIILTLLSGCIDLTKPEQRQLCFQLTLAPETHIPACNTQQKCYSELEKAFPIDSGVLPQTTALDLEQYKDRVASSWFYYNQALKDLKEANKKCLAGNLSELAPHANRINNNLNNAFSEITKANLLSLVILWEEQTSLGSEQLELIDMPDLYNVKAALSNNLSEIKNKVPVPSPDSYAEIYLKANNEFLNFRNQFGFHYQTIPEFSLEELFKYTTKNFLPGTDIPKFFVLDLSTVFVDITTYFLQLITPQAALSLLQHTNPFELSQVIEMFVSTQNSASQKFFSLIQRDTIERKNLKEYISTLETKISSLSLEINDKISRLGEKEMQTFDETFLEQLYFLLEDEATLKATTHEISSIANLEQQAKLKLASQLEAYNSIKSKCYVDGCTLGGQTQTLEEVYLNLKNLNNELSSFNEELFKELELICDSRISKIQSELDSLELPTSLRISISDLTAKLSYYVKTYFEKSSTPEKLNQCKTVLEEHNKLLSAINDFENYQLQTSNSIKTCLSDLDTIFLHSSDLELSKFLPRYQQLKLIPQPYEDPSYILDACNTLLSDVYLHAAKNQKIISIQENYKKSLNLLETLESFSKTYPSLLPEKNLHPYREKLSDLSSFFNQNTLVLAAATPHLDSLYSKTLKLKADLEEETLNTAKLYLTNQYSIEAYSNSTIEANREQQIRIKLTFPNKFFEIPQGFSISLPLENQQKNPETIYKTPNISNISMEQGKITIGFLSLPLGASIVVFDANSLLATTTEKTTLLSITPSKARFEKTLTIHTETKIPKLKLTTQLLQQPDLHYSEIFIYSPESKLNFSQNKNTVEFFLGDAKDNLKLKILFSVLEPLNYNFTLLSIEKIDQNTSRYSYEIEIKNRLPLPHGTAKLLLPLPLKENSTLDAKLYDERGQSLRFSILEGNSISFYTGNFPENSRRTFFLYFTVENFYNYWLQVISTIENSLQKLLDSPHHSIKSEAQTLYNKISQIKQQKDFENPETIKEITEINAQTSALTELNNSLNTQQTEYQSLLLSLEQQLSLLQDNISSLEEASYSDFADELTEALDTATQTINNAEQFAAAADFETALTELFAAQTILSEVPTTDVKEKITQDRDSLLLQTNDLFSSAETHGIESLIWDFKDEINRLDSQINDDLSNNDFSQTKQKLLLFESKVNDLNSFIAEKKSEILAGFRENSENYLTLIDQTIPALLSQLKKIFKHAEDLDMLSVGYVLPITIEQIEQINTELISIKENPLTKKLKKSQFQTPDEILTIKTDLEPNLEAALSIEKTLSSAISSMKESTTIFYNSAVEKFKSSLYNPEVELLLRESKEFFTKGYFLNSIYASKKALRKLAGTKPATSFFAFPEISTFLPAIPFIAIAAVICYFKYFRKNHPNQKMLKKIPRNSY